MNPDQKYKQQQKEISDRLNGQREELLKDLRRNGNGRCFETVY
jgi:hypothetical protein